MFKTIVGFITFFSLLLAETGQTLYAHTCLKSGKTSVSFFENDDCCDKHQAGKSSKSKAKHCGFCEKKSKCCITQTKFIRQTIQLAPVEANNSEVPVQGDCTPFVAVIMLNEQFRNSDFKAELSPQDFSPYLLKSQSSFTCIFRC